MEKNNISAKNAAKQQVINGNKAKAFKPVLPPMERLLREYGFILQGLEQKRINVPNERTYAGKKITREGDKWHLEAFQNVIKDGKLTTVVVLNVKDPDKEKLKEFFSEWFATWKDQTAYSYEGFVAPDGFGGKWQTLYEEAKKKGRLHECTVLLDIPKETRIEDFVKKDEESFEK